jgi:hypothetical protein
MFIDASVVAPQARTGDYRHGDDARTGDAARSALHPGHVINFKINSKQ